MKKVEVTTKHMKLRIAAAVVFLLIGAGALAYAFSEFTSVSEGWQEITAEASDESCAGDFVLMYDIGASGKSARSENRGLVSAYSAAAERAYRIFNESQEFSGVGNLATLNGHPNETVEIDPALYSALELLESFGDRSCYLGPVYDIYDNVFSCTQDWQLEDFDPEANGELRELFGEIAALAADPEAVDIELLGDNRAMLRVSEEYLALSDAQELGPYVDLYRLKNAFIADYLAQALTEKGYTRGSISSHDGFARNLDGESDTVYSLNIIDCPQGRPLVAGRFDYQGPMALVTMRDFPAGEYDGRYYYVTETGSVKHRYLSTEDGLPSKTAGSVTAYSSTLGCAGTALYAQRVFLGEMETAVPELRSAGVEVIIPVGDKICVSQPEAAISGLYQSGSLRYEVRVIE